MSTTLLCVTQVSHQPPLKLAVNGQSPLVHLSLAAQGLQCLDQHYALAGVKYFDSSSFTYRASWGHNKASMSKLLWQSCKHSWMCGYELACSYWYQTHQWTIYQKNANFACGRHCQLYPSSSCTPLHLRSTGLNTLFNPSSFNPLKSAVKGLHTALAIHPSKLGKPYYWLSAGSRVLDSNALTDAKLHPNLLCCRNVRYELHWKPKLKKSTPWKEQRKHASSVVAECNCSICMYQHVNAIPALVFTRLHIKACTP